MKIELPVRIILEKQEADGSVCAHCDEIAWLYHYHYVMIVGNMRICPGIKICQACAEIEPQGLEMVD